MGSYPDELEVYKDQPYSLNCDNNSAINLTQSTKGYGKSKHFVMDYHWIGDAIQLRELDIRYIASEDNLADIFTKVVPKPRALTLLRHMGMTRVRMMGIGHSGGVLWIFSLCLVYFLFLVLILLTIFRLIPPDSSH